MDKGVFTKELEEALRAGEIHVAVHSLKDVPTELEDDFVIAGVLPRAPLMMVRRLHPKNSPKFCAGRYLGSDAGGGRILR